MRVSASSLKTYEQCPRRWGFRKLDGLSEPGTAATERGVAIHKQLETWALTGAEPSDPRAAALMPHFPPPGVGEVEVPVDFQTPSAAFLGYIDAVCDLNANGTFAELASTGTTIILDAKTTSNLKYAKTSAELESDVAATIYAWAAYEGGAQHVTCRWVYVDNKCKVRVVNFDMPLRRVLDQMIDIDKRAGVLQNLWESKATAKQLPVDTSACFAYHSRCPFFDTCQPAQTFSMKLAR